MFELAAERRVPILIHGGRGLPPIADGLRALVDRYPEATLIIAHAGIADLAALARCMAGRKGVLFDTSTWSPIDLLDFYRQIPPEQVVYASDYPYGQQPSSLLIALEDARSRRATPTTSCAAMLAGNANALADGHELPEPTTPIGSDTLAQPMQLARIHQYLSMATPLLWIAAARHGRRARARDQHLRASATATSRRSTGSASCSRRRATCGRRCRRLEDEVEQRVDDAAHVPARPHGGHRGGDRGG